MPQKLKSKFNKYKYLIFTFLSLATFFAITKKQSGYSEDPNNLITKYSGSFFETANADLSSRDMSGGGDGGSGGACI